MQNQMGSNRSSRTFYFNLYMGSYLQLMFGNNKTSMLPFWPRSERKRQKINKIQKRLISNIKDKYQQKTMSDEMKLLHANDNYRLKAQVINSVLKLDLCKLDLGFIVKSFTGQFIFNDLPNHMRKNFSNMSNLYSYLSEPSYCKIDLHKGIIKLCTLLNFQNGNSVELSAGQLELQEYQKGKNEKLNHLIPLVFGDIPLSNSRIKLAFQLFCKTIQELTEHIYQLKKSNKPKDNVGESKKSEKLFFKQEAETIRIPKLGSDLCASTNQLQLQSLNSSIGKENDCFGCSSMVGPNCTHTIQDELNKTKKQINSLKVQFQEHKNLTLKKMTKLEKKEAETEETIKNLRELLEAQKNRNSPSSKTSDIRPRNISIVSNTPTLHKSQCNGKANDKKKENRQYFEENFCSDKKANETFKETVKEAMTPTYVKKTTTPDFSQGNTIQFSPQIHPMKAQCQIDTDCSFIDHFQIIGSFATYTGENWTKTQLLGKKGIQEKPHFSIKIHKTKRRYLWIGVADSCYKTRRWSWGLPNWMYYCAWNGNIYEGPDRKIKSEGLGFKQGQVLDVEINPQNGTITWMVDGVIRAKHSSQKLKNSSIEWVPLIKFFDNGDCIEWIK